jgi:hypothetical protein
MNFLSKRTTIIALVLIVITTAILIWVQITVVPQGVPEEILVHQPDKRNDIVGNDYACTPVEHTYDFPIIKNLPSDWKIYQDKFLGIQFAYPAELKISIEKPQGLSRQQEYNDSEECPVLRGIALTSDIWSMSMDVRTWKTDTVESNGGLRPTDSSTVTTADGKIVSVSMDEDCSGDPGRGPDCGKLVSFTDKGVVVWTLFFALDSSIVPAIPAEEILKTFGIYEPVQ